MKKLGKYLDERSLPRLGVLLCFSAVFMLFASPYAAQRLLRLRFRGVHVVR